MLERKKNKSLEKNLLFIQEVTGTLAAKNSAGAVANLMLKLAVHYTRAEKGSIMMANEQGELYVAASHGMAPGPAERCRLKTGEGIAGKVAEKMEPVLVDNIANDKQLAMNRGARYRTASFISCPLISKSGLQGVLNITGKRNCKPFTNDEFALVKLIARQAAAAIENALLINQLRKKAMELETLNRALIETDVVKTAFLTRISHELRTPLNSIKGAIYYLHGSGGIRPEQNEFHSIIKTEVEKLAFTVENLLDFLRLDDEVKSMKKPKRIEISKRRPVRIHLTQKTSQHKT